MNEAANPLSYMIPTNDTYIAESYTGIYSMHKYWSKKPFNIIRDFICRYSKENEIILDPFCGSGVAVTESVFNRRKVVGIDINPSAIFITRQMVEKIVTEKLANEFRLLESDCKNRINNLYLVRREDKQFIGTHFLWKDGKLIEVWYHNTEGRKGKVADKPNDEDMKLASSFS